MPSGTKYERHQKAVQFLKETKIVDWAGSYKEFADEFGKDQKYKNSDLICITNHQISSFEIKCHKEGSDWGEISWDQAARLLLDEHMIIVEDNSVKEFNGKKFITDFCYFTKNGRVHYNYIRQNKRINTHQITIEKIVAARRLFE
jgi:hypothetical protein